MAYSTTTRAALRVLLQNRYTDDPFWTDTDANDALNEALRQFNLYTGYWRGTATAVTTAASPFLTIPAALTYRTRVYGFGKVLARTSLIGLYRTRRNWRTQTTTDGGRVPTTPREWAPVGLQQVAIWPSDAVGGNSLAFDAVKITPVLTADGQFLDVGDEELQLVLDEALWVLSFKRPSTQPALKPRHQTFLLGCLERNDQIRASSYYRRVLGLDEEQRVAHRLRIKDAEADTRSGLPHGDN